MDAFDIRAFLPGGGSKLSGFGGVCTDHDLGAQFSRCFPRGWLVAWVDGRAHVCGPCFNVFVLRASLAMIARAKDVQVWVFAHLGCIRRAMALIGGGT